MTGFVKPAKCKKKMKKTIVDLFEESARLYPDNVFLLEKTTAIVYHMIREMSIGILTFMINKI